MPKLMYKDVPYCGTHSGTNPNLLINGDFQVNQRGKTEYLSANWNNKVYSVDRWYVHGNGSTPKAKLTVNESGSITLSGAIEPVGLYQVFEKPLEENYYTVTVKVLSLDGIGQVYFNEDVHALTVGLNAFTWYGTLESIRLMVDAYKNMEVEYVKLEQGEIATPFIPRHYTEELLLCKRYFQSIYLSKRPPYLEKKFFGGMQYQVSMRVYPTVTYLMKDEHNNDISSDVKTVSCDNNQILEIETNSEHDSIYGYLSADSEIY